MRGCLLRKIALPQSIQKTAPYKFRSNCLDGTSDLRREGSLQGLFKQFQSFVWMAMFGIPDHADEVKETVSVAKNLPFFQRA